MALIEAVHTIKDEFLAYGFATRADNAPASGLGGEPQRDQAPEAHARHTSAAPAALRGHKAQRPRRARHSGRFQRPPDRWPEPAPGRRSDLHREPRRLRLSGRDHRCAVAPRLRLRDRPMDRCAADACGAGAGDRALFPDVSGTRQRRKEPATLRSPKSSTLYETVASQTKKTRELPCPHLNLHILSHTLFMPLRCTTARSSVISCVVRSDCSTSSH